MRASNNKSSTRYNWFSIFFRKKSSQRRKPNVVKFSKRLCVLSLVYRSPLFFLFILTFAGLVFLHISYTIDARRRVVPRSFFTSQRVPVRRKYFCVSRASCVDLWRDFFSLHLVFWKDFSKIASRRSALLVLLLSTGKFFGGLPILVVDTHKQWFGERRRDTLGWLLKSSYIHVPWRYKYVFCLFGWGHLYIYVWWTHNIFFYIAWPVS